MCLVFFVAVGSPSAEVCKRELDNSSLGSPKGSQHPMGQDLALAHPVVEMVQGIRQCLQIREDLHRWQGPGCSSDGMDAG